MFLYLPLIAQQNSSGVQVGIDEKLGGFIPEEAFFTTSDGDTIILGEYIDKPTIVSLVYYNCPGICTPLLGGMVDVFDKIDLKPGIDYQVLTISFNPEDSTELARNKKKNYMRSFDKQFPEEAWTWATGDSLNIQKFTKAVGFRFMRDREDFAHPASLIVLSPEGKVTRYLYGITYLPFDLKMAIIEASEGRATPTVSKILQFCFSYDREGQKYAFNFTRVGGSIILLFIIVFFVVVVMKPKRKKIRRG
jgi:protein SCO1/2